MEKIIAKNREHLRILIDKAMKERGNDANLNFIDVSNVTDMKDMFYDSPFNGDISD